MTKMTLEMALYSNIARWFHIILRFKYKDKLQWVHHTINVTFIIFSLLWIGFVIKISICPSCGSDVSGRVVVSSTKIAFSMYIAS